MAVTQDRIVLLLEQYRNRLHQVGDAEHDEELDYLKQILESPLFQEYMQDGGILSHEETFAISEATNELLTDMDLENTQHSLMEKRKRLVQRRKSLKALRNAVTPKNSPRVQPKKAHGHHHSSSNSKTSGSSIQQREAPWSPYGKTFDSSSTATARMGSQNVTPSAISSAASPRLILKDAQIHPELLPVDKQEQQSSFVSNGLDFNLSIGSPLDIRSKTLSNSTNTLIERPTSPNSYDSQRKKSSDSLLSAAGGFSGSQPNISMLRITREGDLNIDFDQLQSCTPNNKQYNSSSHSLQQQQQQQLSIPSPSANDTKLSSGLNIPIAPISPSADRPPPPSYLTHLQQQQQQQSTHTPLKATSPTSRPPPPPYGQKSFVPQRKVKSFDKLLDDSETTVPIHFPVPGGPAPPPLVPLAHPMTDGLVTQDLPTVDKRRTTLTIQLEKGDEGLGFRVKGLRSEQKGELIVQDLMPGGLAERDGRLRRNDQIIYINGRSLEGQPHSEAVKLLQSTRGIVELVISRDSSHTSAASPLTSGGRVPKWVTPPPVSLSQGSPLSPVKPHSETVVENGQHLEEESELDTPTPPPNANQPAYRQKIEKIELRNGGHGFGFGVISAEDGRTVVHSIVQGGIAERDGRLRQNDQLLQINEESVIHMRHEEVIGKLRIVSQSGKPMKLVISRRVCSGESEMVPDINDSSDEEVEQFEVELNKLNRGLGLTIAGLVKTDTEEEVSGIYITSLNPHGPAAKDGRVRVGDRIMKVDGHSLRGLENMEAASVLRNSGDPVKLVLSRKRRKRSVSPHELGGYAGSAQAIPPEPQYQSHDHAHHHDDDNVGIPKPLSQDESGSMDVTERSKVVENGFESEYHSDSIEPSAEDLMKKWSAILGPDYEVKVDKVTKSEDGGLGIRMESTAELDDAGNPQMHSLHHVIRYVHPEGPIGEHNILHEGDEILVVNGKVLVGLQHDQAIDVVKNMPNYVTIVVCRLLSDDVGGEEEEPERAESHLTESETTTEGGIQTAYTSESEDDKHFNMSTPDSLQALPSFDISGFARRFERQSWRQRHEEQRKMLMKNFEQKREEYERSIQKQEEELRQQEILLKERQQRQAQEQDEGDLIDEDQRNFFDFQLDYSITPYHDPGPNFDVHVDQQVTSPDSMQDESDSSTSVLSPVPGSTLWESYLSEIDLEKGVEGLGFSILDFQDPRHPGDRVILVHSLVKQGTAERDGRLKKGDKLLSVNDISVVNHSLQFAVDQLVAVPTGGVARVGVNHPLPASPEINSDPTSPLGMVVESGQFFNEGQSTLRNATSTEFEDEEKPLSDEDEPETRPQESQESEEFEECDEEEGEDVARFKKKKPSETDDDDDEPPPPYTENDPQDLKLELKGDPQEGGTGGKGPPRDSDGHLLEQPTLETNENLGTQVQRELEANSSMHDIDTERESVSNSDLDSESRPPTTASSRSPASRSRISSPEHGKSLSDLTRITPEDEALLNQHKSASPSSQHLNLPQDDQLDSQYSSDTTLVNSESQPSQPEVGPDSNTSVISSSSASTTPKVTKGGSKDNRNCKDETGSSSKTKTKKKKMIELKSREKGNRKFMKGKNKEKVQKSQAPRSPLEKQTPAHSLTVNYALSQASFTNSQESFLDGLSPEFSDGGDHSNEMESEPREIKISIRKGHSPGMHLTLDESNNYIIVKSVSSSGAIGKDGRIRVGDRIDAINGKCLTGLSLVKVKNILKRASSKTEELIIVYAPAPQSFMLHSSSYDKPMGRTPSGNAGMLHGSAAQQSYQTSQATQMPQPGIQIISPQSTMSHMMQAPPQWPMEGVSPYHPANIAGIGTMGMQSGYYSNSKPPPPPYMYPHQPGHNPNLMSTPQPPYTSPHMTQPNWSMRGQQQQQQQAGGMHMTTAHNVGMVMHHAPPPNVIPPWGIPPGPTGPSMLHREPPQYGDVHVMAAAAQQQTMGAQPTQLGVQQAQMGVAQPQMVQSPHGQFQMQQTSHMTNHMASKPQQQQGQHQKIPRPMNKSQSETKFQNIIHPRSGASRRHNSQGDSSAVSRQFLPMYRHRSKKRGHKPEDSFEEEPAEQMEMISSNSRIQSVPQGEPSRGNGGEKLKFPRAASLQESPEHSHHNSWAIEEEEDPLIRAEFPDVEGHLFEVTLNKGKRGGLGLSIVANTNKESIQGIVIMGIQKGGVAEQCNRIKWGDMILKVNNTCVVGLSQQEVQELLRSAPPTVRFILLRQDMNTRRSNNNSSSGGLQLTQHAPGDSDISLEGLAQVQAITLRREDKKGFGFTIEKCEQGSSPSVIVGSITPRGPADMDGQLQVGDQILSVDNQKILGYAFEKARLLIQQARGRGHVTLVVATRSASSLAALSQQQYGGDGAEQAGIKVDYKSSQIPEGVVLRKKKTSLKTSRRRPVSVDYDRNATSQDSHVGGVAGGGASSSFKVAGAQPESNRSSQYSNRNSHPFTERDMEQSLLNFDKQTVIDPFKECEIVIFKKSQVLGVIITGGADSVLEGVYIQKILPDSPASKDGRLKPGDQILTVNDVSMSRLTRDEALQALQRSSSTVRLRVMRDPNRTATVLHGEVPTSPIGSGEIETVELQKPERGGLGLLICEQEDRPGVYVQQVVEKKAAYTDGRIRPGDKILAINGQDIYNSSQNFVVQLLQSCQGSVSLTVQHQRTSTSPCSQPEYGGSREIDGPHPAFQSRPPPDYPYSLPTGRDREPPPYSSNSQSGPTRPLFQTNGGNYGNSNPDFIPMRYQYGATPTIFRVGGDVDIDMPISSQEEEEEDHAFKIIRLHRGPSGLGFSIVGGKGSVQGDLPIYIKSVFEKGAAGKDGRLKKGDLLLAVNGISFENVTKDYAVETLKCLQGDVELTVLSSD